MLFGVVDNAEKDTCGSRANGVLPASRIACSPLTEPLLQT